MKRRYFISILMLIFIFNVGCAKQPSLPQIGVFTEVYGVPHIVQDDVCYYLSHWGPGATVLKIYYKGSNEKGDSNLPGIYAHHGIYYQQITSIEWERIDEDDLPIYIPLLIKSLKDITPAGTGSKALSWLHFIVSIEFPNGYGDYYMHPTKDGFTGTPFERDELNRYPKLDETSYKKWKQWWDTEGHTAFP